MGEEREFSTRWGKMKYSVSGNGCEYAVMLQGWATVRALYGEISSAVEARYTVIAPALHGFGESDEPIEPMSVSDYASAVNDLLTYLKIKRAVFFCHSFGGRVFFKLNAMEGRFTEPEKVILCDVAGIVPRKSLLARARIGLFKAGKSFLSLPFMKKAFPSAPEKLRSRSGSDDYRAASEMMKRVLVMAVNEDLRHLFPTISCPALIMWGRQDTAVPLSDAYVIESSVADSAVIVFEESGHFPFLTEKARFLAVVRSFFGIS